MENSLATARAILVGSAVLALVIAGIVGEWVVAGILAVGVTAHTVHILRVRSRSKSVEPPRDLTVS